MARNSLLRETHDTLIELKTVVEHDLPRLWKAVIGLYAVWGSIVVGTVVHAVWGN